MATPEEILKKYWGYDSFRPLQKEIISSVLVGQDVLALLPTGGGKSLCYQVPALMMDGFCLVVSPLIALMQDQVSRLSSLEIPAACIYSGMNYKAVKQVLENTIHGDYKLLYVSPERLQTYMFNDYLHSMDLSLVAVDEAHCVSQWGHDFRPDYLEIATLRGMFTKTPFLALTATATPEIQNDIATQLKLRKPVVYKQSFARENIFFEVRYAENKNGEAIDTINRHCSIIYCRSRKQTEATGKTLIQQGIPSAVYHAGMSRENREAAQAVWMNNQAPVMVATTAFGMGIDKPDVRMVLHYDAPEHLEAWYQEAGRAGRDGLPAHALTLYNSMDIKRLRDSTALQFPPELYLRNVYQSVAEYLQVPIGSEPHKYYPFDVFDFCMKFSYKPTEVLPALKLLEREGLWTLTEAVYSPSTIQFITNRNVLDNLYRSHPQLSYLSVGLLRMYNTIFYFPTPVRESAIAHQLKIKKADLLNGLEQLQRMEIIEYNVAGEGPQLFFHHCRVDSRHLIIDLNRINTYRRRHEIRTEAMLGFLSNQSVCREKIVLSYFGEMQGKDCGHCDICVAKSSPNPGSKALSDQVLKEIQSKGVSFKQLITKFPANQKETVATMIREMIDKNILRVTFNGELSIIKGSLFKPGG